MRMITKSLNGFFYRPLITSTGSSKLIWCVKTIIRTVNTRMINVNTSIK